MGVENDGEWFAVEMFDDTRTTILGEIFNGTATTAL